MEELSKVMKDIRRLGMYATKRYTIPVIEE